MTVGREQDLGATPRLRTAVVGLGRIGFQFHVPAILRHPGFELVGVVDPVGERRTEARRKWGVEAFETLPSALAASHPDLVVIASPTSFHAEQAREALAGGSHVFCEKPAARSVAEFDSMLAAAALANRRLLAYQPYRMKGGAVALRSLLAGGLVGEPYLIKRSYCTFERRRDWQAFQAHGGGQLNNAGAHFIDEMLYVLEPQKISKVFCQTRRVVSAGDADDYAKIVLITEAGVLVDLDIGQAFAQPLPPWAVFGSRGSARWNEEERCWIVRSFDPGVARAVSAEEGLAAEGRLYFHDDVAWREDRVGAEEIDPEDYYDRAWRYFLTGEDPPVAPLSTRYLLEVIERCRASAAGNGVA